MIKKENIKQEKQEIKEKDVENEVSSVELIKETKEKIESISQTEEELDNREKEELLEKNYNQDEIIEIYSETEEKKKFEKIQSEIELEKLEAKESESENFKKNKLSILKKLNNENSSQKREILKKEFENLVKQEAIDVAQKEGKSEAFKNVILNSLEELSQNEIEKNGYSFANIINKISEISDKYLYFYLPKKLKDGKFGKYIKYAGASAMGTALVAGLAPSGAMASVGIGGYFAIKLGKKILAANVGGFVGASAVKVYEKMFIEKKEKKEKENIEQLIENNESIDKIYQLIEDTDSKKIKRENNKLKIALIGGMAGGLGTYFSLDNLEADVFSQKAHDLEKNDSSFSKEVIKKTYDGSSSSNKIIHKLQKLFNLTQH